jgi:hypothetical protein
MSRSGLNQNSEQYTATGFDHLQSAPPLRKLKNDATYDHGGNYFSRFTVVLRSLPVFKAKIDVLPRVSCDDCDREDIKAFKLRGSCDCRRE